MLTLLISRFRIWPTANLSGNFSQISDIVPHTNRQAAIGLHVASDVELPRVIAIEALRTVRLLIDLAMARQDYSVPDMLMYIMAIAPSVYLGGILWKQPDRYYEPGFHRWSVPRSTGRTGAASTS